MQTSRLEAQLICSTMLMMLSDKQKETVKVKEIGGVNKQLEMGGWRVGPPVGKPGTLTQTCI